MDFSQEFQALNVHSEAHGKADNEETPFLVTARLKEDDTECLYGCAYNQYLRGEDDQALATVGSRFIHVYSLPRDINMLKPQCSVTLDVKNEDLYTVTWCYDTYDEKKRRSPYKIVTGGALGQLYIIDACSGKWLNSNETPGGAVNDLRTSPTNSNLVACATKDSTIRIFHIRNDACLVVMAGLDCHVDQVLSVDWSADGKYILSCGFDHRIMKWDISAEHVKKHLDAACEALECGRRNILNQKASLQDEDDAPSKKLPKMSSQQNNVASTSKAEKVIDKYAEISMNPIGCMLTIYEPTHVCSDLHVDYVDCVRILGRSDYITSKECGKESSVNLWRFGAPKGIPVKESDRKPSTAQTSLGKFSIKKGSKWFIKFAVDPKLAWIVCGETDGHISFFDLKVPRAEPLMRIKVAKDIVRQVSFSPDGRLMVAVTHKAEVIRFDRVPASIRSEDLPKLSVPKL